MARQILIIGLGQFGMSLALGLSSHGSEVLAVDISESHINEIAPHVADAVIMDAMDEEALASLAPSKRDICICAIGDDFREGSIIVTALLKQLGAQYIISRATNSLHGRILSLVGANEVIYPEQNFGERLAIRLAWKNVVNILPLGGTLVLTEVNVPDSFLGRSLAELNLPKRFSVTVSAVRRDTGSGMVATIPDPHRPLEKGDILMLVADEENVHRLTQRI